MVNKQNVEDITGLSPTQEGMLFHYLKDPSGRQYFEQLRLDLSGQVDKMLFEKAWNEVAARNEALRTVFRWEKLGNPVQITLKEQAVTFRYHDLADTAVETIMAADKAEGFDLSQGAFRVTLINVNDGKFVMLISNHHILYDGWSNAVLLKEFFNAYEGLVFDKPVEWLNKSTYKQFITAIRSFDKAKHQGYWTKYLDGFESVTSLPFAKRTTDRPSSFLKHAVVPGNESRTQLRSFLSDKKLTLASLIYTVWGMVLSKCVHNRDIVFGIIVSGRKLRIDHIDNTVGLFINTVPVRFKFSGDQFIEQMIQQVSADMGDLQEYENTPLVDIREYSGVKQEHDLFYSIVVIENYPLDRQIGDMRAVKVDSYSMDETTNYDLTITVHDREELQIEFKYDPSIFEGVDIKRIAGYFLNVLNQITAAKAMTIGEVDMLHEDERLQVLELFNQTDLPYNDNDTIVSLFEEQVERTPDSVAVSSGSQNITYTQLNECANQLAAYLRHVHNVKHGIPVGIRLARTEWMIIAMMGVLKSGGAYVPLDPAYPKERVEYMISDSGCTVVIDNEELKRFRIVQDDYVTNNPANINGSNDLAYIIYTSGSTGRPKGVMIGHSSVNAFLHWCRQEFANSDFDVVYAATSVCFDLSVYEIFYTLTNGKKIKLLNSALEIAGQLDTKEKVLLNTVPGVIGELLEQKTNLDAVTVLNMAGEPVPAAFMDKLPVDRMEIRNLYGPTEDTTYSTVCRMERGWQLSIGKPKANTQVYILDEYDQPCALGVAGEICISGRGLALGYMNRQELTDEKFVTNPFRKGERMYRTGDLGYWMADGTISFLGRADNQIKIRGYRIELGEIEQVLRKQQGVKDCVVTAIGYGTDRSLCAYVIIEGQLNVELLQSGLANELPGFMVPQHYVQLEKFPLTSNGKIDRKALPVLHSANSVGHVAPADKVEEQLVKLWSELLNIPAANISTAAGFFELGGHSLKATRLVSRIHKEFDVKLPLTELFRSPRLNAIATYIRSHASEGVYESIPKVQPKNYYQLSPAQERMFILQQLHPAATGYNMPVVFPLPAGSSVIRVDSVLEQLIARHESLRTSFEIKDDVPVQRIHEKVSFKLDCYELDEAGFEALQARFVQPFELDSAPLFRAAYVQVAGGKAYLLADMHHIISDGVSQTILEREFMALYRGEQLPPLRLQYKDFSDWVNTEAQQSRIKAQEEFWLQAFAGELPIAELPYDHPRPTIRSFDGRRVSIQFHDSELHTLRQVCGEQGVTPYMFLLSVINIWLSKLTGDEDVIVLSPVAARRHEDLENIIGLFVNTIALRSFPKGEKSYSDYLKEVKQSTLNAYERQEYGFETLVDKLQVRRDLSRNPLSDVMFVLQNQAEVQVRDQDYREGSPLQPSKFDITLTATEQTDGLQLDINYSAQLFDASTMERLAGYLRQIIQVLSSDIDIKIKEIQLVDATEKHRLLKEFNGTKANFPQHLTLTQLFEEQVSAHPDAVAVVSGDQRLSYRELNEMSNQLARYLREEYNVQPDELVGLLLERSEWMIVAMLAVLKSGGAYVPIDPAYPTQRIEYMIADSDCIAVIDEKELKHFRRNLQAYSKNDLDSIHDAGSLAYVIYTSGTTGKPKGSLVTHANVVRLLVTDSPLFDFGPQDAWTFFHSYCFDFSVWEMYGALLFGGKLVMVPSATARDSAAMLDLLRSEKITVFNQTPSSFYNIIQEAIEHPVGTLDLRYVIFGGEALRPAKLKSWNEQYPEVRLINMYGITETTVHVTYKEITSKEIEDGRSNIGKPIPTLTCYVLDKWGQLVPPGVFGELYVGGAGVARGYLNREELTAQRFIPSPFEHGERLYRSGDKARWLATGDLEYSGRLDEQVKIRGYRIELAEIERTLLANSNIREAVVLVQPDGKGEPCLVAYLTAKEKLAISQVKEQLSFTLPDYMLPSYYLQLESLPLTSNGKLDKKSLPLPQDMGITIMTAYIAPRTAVEKQLAGIWSEVLGYEKDVISIESNFFEIGGHSLKAYTLTSRIHKEFDVRFPLAEIFRTSTIRSMSEYIMALDVAKKKKEHQPIKKSIVKI